MLVDGKKYEPVSTWMPLEIPDSFVARSNKLNSTSGNGEAKYYVGSSVDSNLRDFFGDSYFTIRAFFIRDELISYMDSVQHDYQAAAQTHRGGEGLSQLWTERRKLLTSKSSGAIWFNASEQRAGGRRCYINGVGDYDLLRELPLPHATEVLIDKLASSGGEIIYRFRLELDRSTTISPPPIVVDEYELRESNEQKIISEIKADNSLSETGKESLIVSRVGQGKYRRELLESCGSKCPISQITDERILRASHIKPWRMASNSERLDPNNGLILAPTYDLLFDQGLITFEADKTLKISSKLSAETVRKLGLIDRSKFKDVPISSDSQKQRLKYLEFHRQNIFKE